MDTIVEAMTGTEFRQFISACTEELKRKQDLLEVNYGLGRQPKYWFDQDEGKLQFKEVDGTVKLEATITPVGSFSEKSNTWLWAWENDSVVEALKTKAARIKALANAAGIGQFDKPRIKADEITGWELTSNSRAAFGFHRLLSDSAQ